MPPPLPLRGNCHLLEAFDVGFEIDLVRAKAALAEPGRTRRYLGRGRVQVGERTSGQAWRSLRKCEPLDLNGKPTEAEVEITLYRFGVLSLTFTVPFRGDGEALRQLAAAACEHEGLRCIARDTAEEILRDLGDAVSRPHLPDVREDYRLFVLEPQDGETLRQLEGAPQLLAGTLRADTQSLAQNEIADAVRERLSYAPGEAVWVNWLGAMLIGEDMDAECDVLELATAELTATRFLDARLQDGLEAAYHSLERAGRGLGRLRLRAADLRHAAQLQADHALLREIADNPLKLHGDDYLARLYEAASRRFRFDDRDAAVERKLAAVREIHRQATDLACLFRGEILEWIIIILIAVDIVVYLRP